MAYLLDQVGGTYHMEQRFERARDYFAEEISFLEGIDSPKAAFHLATAYRNLASALSMLERKDEALQAIAQSRHYAEASNNEQARRLAALVEQRLDDGGAEPAPLDLLAELPADHPVAHVMALNALAELLLTKGDRATGERLLRRAHQEAERLGYGHEVDTSKAIAQRFGLSIGEERR